jgi:uncharacterized protein (DUF1330 family)
MATSPRIVIIEFPTREAAESWYKSADYQKIIDLSPLDEPAALGTAPCPRVEGV